MTDNSDDPRKYVVRNHKWWDKTEEERFETYSEAELFAVEFPSSDPMEIWNYETDEIEAFVYLTRVYKPVNPDEPIN